MRLHLCVYSFAAAVALLTSASASAASASSSLSNLHGLAESTIVGMTSTATLAGGGNPIYQANTSQYSGVVTLIMDEGTAGSFICSGSLLSDHVTILTAGHCVSHGAGTANPIKTTVYFPYAGMSGDTVLYADSNAPTRTVTTYYVNPKYSGQVIDQNDIAVLRLDSAAPSYNTGYSLYTGTDLTGLEYNVAGYGSRSDVGGAVGADLGTGRLRQGTNVYDFRLGDSDFGGEDWATDFGGAGQTDYTYLADFDSGLAANDSSCLLASYFGLSGSKYCNSSATLATEVSTAGGDSGGPEFVDGKIASVTSFGLTFGTDIGDVDNKLNDTWGEFNGFVPVAQNLAFIESIPEPATWAMFLIGFGLLGIAMRSLRRKDTTVTA